MEPVKIQKPISSVETHTSTGSLRPTEVHYAGHSKHCECIEIAKQFERAYAERTAKMALLERVARAAQSHHHLANEEGCSICVYLRELNG